MVCDGPSKTGEDDDRCNVCKPGQCRHLILTPSGLSESCISPSGYMTIADAKFIQKCSAVGTWARTSAIPSCNVAAATSCWRRSATPYCRATQRGDHLLGALKVVVGGEDCVGHSITRAPAQRHEADQHRVHHWVHVQIHAPGAEMVRQPRGREDIVLRERR